MVDNASKISVQTSLYKAIRIHHDEATAEETSDSTDSSWDTLRPSIGSNTFNPIGRSRKDKYKGHKALQELTINKLNYQNVGLIGRNDEVDTLRCCLRRAAQASSHLENHVKKEFIVIEGYSGVGKSTIAKTADSYVKEISNGRVVQGKFDQNNYEEPLSGISAVFGQLCENIVDGAGKCDKALVSVQESMLVELMSEIEVLQRLIPSLSDLALALSERSVASQEENDNSYGAEFERLKYAFRVLTRLLCSHFSPLVLILDDLQWADTASLQTIDFLLSDTENNHGLVVIGLYRSNEVGETHLLTQTLSDLDSKSEMIGLNISRIEVKSLDIIGVNSIIMAMLGIDDDGLTNGLAEICFRRTLGNPFFVIEFMTMLEMENLIMFNLGLLKWTWDEKIIEESTMSTANVVDLLQAKMKRLPEKIQILMHYAACLGAEFNIHTLETILKESTFIQEDNSIDAPAKQIEESPASNPKSSANTTKKKKKKAKKKKAAAAAAKKQPKTEPEAKPAVALAASGKKKKGAAAAHAPDPTPAPAPEPAKEPAPAVMDEDDEDNDECNVARLLNSNQLRKVKKKKKKKKKKKAAAAEAEHMNEQDEGSLVVANKHHPNNNSAAATSSLDADAKRTEVFHGMLQTLQDGNFIEKSGPESFRWIHDKIQEAALSYGLASEPSFQYGVGWILFNNLSGNEFEEMLFDIVNLINKGTYSDCPDFAELNLRAAKKARRISAFQTAASYANIGLKFLPENKWVDYSSLTLSLYTLGAEMEVTLGNTDIADEYMREVLAQDRLTQLEKLPMYVAKSYMLVNIQSKYNEALDFLCRTLKEFGYWVPLGALQPFHVLRIFRRTVNAARKKPISSYESPKLMTNPKDKAAMSLLSRIAYASYFIRNKFLLVFSASQMVQMTIDLGVSSLSGYAYATLGMITNMALGDHKTSSFFAETAIFIQKSFPSKHIESQTVLLCSQSVLPWTKPIQSQLENLRRAHSLGMRSGNIEFGMWSLHVAGLVSQWIIGKPLDLIITECERMVPIMEDLKQSEQVWATRSGWQLALNLKGLVDDELVLHGQALRKGQGSESEHTRVLQEYFQSDLYLFFGHYKLAAESALKRGEKFNEVVSGSWLMIETFHRAVALFALGRKTRESKYLRPANKLRKRIAKWAQVNPNVKHHEHFLQAEYLAVKRNYKDAKIQYGEAIRIAARTGHLHHAGLFNERFADFYETILMDEEEALYRLKESVRWYSVWGADLKVQSLSADLSSRNSLNGFEE